MAGSIVLFEDGSVEDMWPITLTRPAFGVTCGIYNLYQVASLACENVDYVVRDYLSAVTERAFPRSGPADGPILFVNAAVAPDTRYAGRFRSMLEEGEPCLCTAGERVAAALVPEQREVPELSAGKVSGFLLELGLPVTDGEPFRTLDYPFHLIGALEEVFPANAERKIADGDYTELRPGVYVGRNVQVADTAVFHSDEGPVVLDDGVRVLDFTFFEGPVYVGPNSRIIERSSVKECTSVSHTCKVGGEVEASIVEAYSNKQHHGFLGHAYVGSWVNLGAGTSNSDLKNTYGTVRIQHRGRRLETGMQFVGCVIGDYSKSAINTSIFTGKVIGVSSMLYGCIGQNVPSYCNFAKSFGQITQMTVEQTIITQKRMFVRRDVEQTEEDIQLLRDVFELTRGERELSEEPPVF